MTGRSKGASVQDMNVRVVSYNVLSSRLAEPDHFTTCSAENLEQANRLEKVLRKLTEEIDEVKQKSADTAGVVFCLQELSVDWIGALHAYFANRGYHFVTGLYGKKHNGYMGEGIAYSLQDFETVEVHVERLSEKREEGWPRPLPENESSGRNVVINTLGSLLATATRLSTGYVLPAVRTILRIEAPKPALDHWQASENRFNQLLTVCLKPKKSSDGSVFYVSNYHMPCMYYAPMVMTIHVDLAVGRAQRLAGQYPLVLAGDFNIKPDSPQYRMVTSLQGSHLPEDHPEYPAPKYGMEWKPSQLQPMRSAYAASEQGEEPDFTNFAQTDDNPPFVATLDYIFLSHQWNVDRVRSIPHREEANGPYPNDTEPSDHVLISADLSLSKLGS